MDDDTITVPRNLLLEAERQIFAYWLTLEADVAKFIDNPKARANARRRANEARELRREITRLLSGE